MHLLPFLLSPTSSRAYRPNQTPDCRSLTRECHPRGAHMPITTRRPRWLLAGLRRIASRVQTVTKV